MFFIPTAFQKLDFVKSGLTLYLDGNDKTSYAGSGPSIRNLTTSSNLDATIISGSVFQPTVGYGSFRMNRDSKINIPYNTSVVQNGNTTVECWVRLDDVSGTFGVIFTNRGFNDADTTFTLLFDDRGVIRTWNPTGTSRRVLIYGIGAGDNASSFWAYATSTFGPVNVGDGKFHQVVGVTNKTTNVQTLYYDGVPVMNVNLSGTIPVPTESVRLGGGYTPALLDFPMSGSVATVRIYNRALSTNEIIQNYSSSISKFA